MASWPFLGYAAGIAHALAMAVWLGGLILLARVVLAGPGEEDLVHAVRGFARISTPALAVTIFTGFIQMYRLDWGEIFTSSHGRVLFLKSIAVGAMVFLGVAARQFIKERVARVDAMTGQLAVRLRRAVGIEAVCGIVVLTLTAWMLSLSPPQGGGHNRHHQGSRRELAYHQRLRRRDGEVQRGRRPQRRSGRGRQAGDRDRRAGNRLQPADRRDGGQGDAQRTAH